MGNNSVHRNEPYCCPCDRTTTLLSLNQALTDSLLSACVCQSLPSRFHSRSSSRKRCTGGESSSSCHTKTSGTSCNGFNRTKCNAGDGVTTDSVTTQSSAPASP